MPQSPEDDFPPRLILASDFRRAFDIDLRLRRQAERGELHRLARGQYLDLKSAVAMADRAIAVDRTGRIQPLTTKARLLETWARMLPFRGSVRARAVIDFASTLSGSPNESGSRVNVALSGFPEPVLQHPFVVDGKTVFTDFYWIDEDAVGEADGKGKYFDPVMLDGRTTAEAVYDEKRREDGVRRQVHAFTRWDFPVGMSQSRLRTRLLQLGLPIGRPRLQLK